MGNITLITGGARSGKSTFAEKSVELANDKTAYIATAVPFDDGMKDRIKKHIEQRPKEWTTFEKHTKIDEIIDEVKGEHNVVLLDCITVLITNTLFEDASIDWDIVDYETIDKIEKKVQNDLERMMIKFKESKLDVFMVTNEVGQGIVPENKLARIFRDIAGRANQYLASEADEVYFVVSGIPMKIKG